MATTDLRRTPHRPKRRQNPRRRQARPGAARPRSRLEAAAPRPRPADGAAEARATRQADGARGVRVGQPVLGRTATEEILKVAVPAIGVLAFSMVMPVTFGILAVLAILLFSYRQTIKAYPSAGGAYIVTKDNFGVLATQLAGVALLTDYVLTVSVSVAAGVAAITSAVPSLYERVWLSVAFIWIIAWGNLRGVPRVRTDVRRPHLLLHRDDVPAPRHRDREGARRRSAPDADPRRRRRDDRGDRRLPAAARVRVRGGGRDGRRGHLERHPRVQAARVAPRADDPDVDGLPPGRHVPRALVPRDEAPDHAQRDEDGHLAGRAGGLRERWHRDRVVPDAAGGDDADPDPGGQHVLRGLPAPRELPAATPSCRPLTKRGHRLVFSNGSSPSRSRRPRSSFSSEPTCTG